jgi:hypothetical protein
MKKPSLADLATKKTAAATIADEPQPHDEPKAVKRGSQPDGRKGILIRVNPEGWRELRDLAAELTLSSGDQVTMQSLITDAINDTLKRHKRPPVA